MYVRKSDDVDDILDVVTGCVIHIAQTLKNLPASLQRHQLIYLERWALDALESYMHSTQSRERLTEIESSDGKRTLRLKNSKVILKEWTPEEDSLLS